MIPSGNQPVVDFYPIVVALDDDTLENCKGDGDSLYNAFASEASGFASERSWRLEDKNIQFETLTTENQPNNNAMSPQRRRKPGVRLLQKNRRFSQPGVFANIRSMLHLGNQRTINTKSADRNNGPEDSLSSDVSPIPSPSRECGKRYRPRRFHDEYVLTQQIVKCRVSTLWECVHRPTGRRFCAKAIDKRCFGSQSDRTVAAREIKMHQLCLQTSYPSCLPRIREIFVHRELMEPTQQHDECKSATSCCSESTRSISGPLACDDTHWYIVQDFVAGGGNLRQFLLRRENGPFNGSEISRNDNEEHKMSNSNEFYALAEASRAASRTMQESEVRSLARVLLLALNELHRQSICHNDLCPENILVPLFSTNERDDKDAEELREWNQHSNDCETLSYRHGRHRRKQLHDNSCESCWDDLKLCDLGRSFFVDELHERGTTDCNSTDKELPRHSSIYYTSPEVILGRRPGLASDLWSVGVILYRCLAGELPFSERRNDHSNLAHCSTLESISPSSSSSPPLVVVPPPAPMSKSMLRDQLKRDICRAKCNFGQSKYRRKTDIRWSRVSRGAKQFLLALLNPSSSARLTCDEALQHPWVMNGVSERGLPLHSSSSLPTCTTHYHLHPIYPTSMVNRGEENYLHHQGEDENINDEKNSSPKMARRPKSFVHTLFGSLKNEE